MQQVSNGVENVAWLGDGSPPMALASYLRRHGIELATPVAGAPLPAARLITLDGVARAPGRSSVSECTVTLVHPEGADADAIGAVLQSHGAHVTRLRPDDSLERMQALVPDAILIDAADLHRSCWQLIRALWSHTWLRFVPVLVAPPGSLRAPPGKTWDLAGIDAGLHFLQHGRARLTATVRQHAHLTLPLDRLGAARMLRALMDSERSLRIRVDTEAHTFHVDVVGSLVFGAYGGPRDEADACAPWEAPWVGATALAALLACDEGDVSVRECEQLTATNIMTPLSTALESAMTAPIERGVTSDLPRSASQLVAVPPLGQTSGARGRSRNDRTLAGMGTAQRLSGPRSPALTVPRSGSLPRRRDDRTLAGVGTAQQLEAAHEPSNAARADDRSVVTVSSAVKPAEPVASGADASPRAARRALDHTLIGIGASDAVRAVAEDEPSAPIRGESVEPLADVFAPLSVSGEHRLADISRASSAAHCAEPPATTFDDSAFRMPPTPVTFDDERDATLDVGPRSELLTAVTLLAVMLLAALLGYTLYTQP